MIPPWRAKLKTWLAEAEAKRAQDDLALAALRRDLDDPGGTDPHLAQSVPPPAREYYGARVPQHVADLAQIVRAFPGVFMPLLLDLLGEQIGLIIHDTLRELQLGARNRHATRSFSESAGTCHPGRD